MKVSVIGLGYVGLPLALTIAEKGIEIVGVDTNTEIVDEVARKKTSLKDPFVVELLQKNDLQTSTLVQSTDIYIICVPTPVDETKKPDLSHVISAVAAVCKVVQDSQLIIIESTINPGVSEDEILPILRRTGKKIRLAHCPERINPGDMKWNVSNIPRVVGGVDKESTAMAAEFYRKVIDAPIMEVSQIKAAEATKILENTFRDVNIAFVNEMAQSFFHLGIDVLEVIRGAATKPFGFLPHYPGIGVGGHCIAVDPYYMIEKGKEIGFDHDFLSLARRINSSMPEFTFRIVQDALNDLQKTVNGSRITVLGLAYKPNVADDRESPSYEIINILRKNKAIISVYDPYFPEKSTHDTLWEALEDTDCILLATAHNEFIEDIEMYKGIQILVDGRNCLDKEKVEGLGIKYVGIGRR
jgi:nucleotide sugar dehydrogenase